MLESWREGLEDMDRRSALLLVCCNTNSRSDELNREKSCAQRLLRACEGAQKS